MTAENETVPPKCFWPFHQWRRSLHMPGLKRCTRCGWFRRSDEMGAGTIVSWYRPTTFGEPRMTADATLPASDDLTPEVLARWEELAANATDTMRDSGNDEPWGVYASAEGWEAESRLSFGPDNSNAVGVIHEGVALADFVAESFTAVPALLSGVRSRDARIAELEAEVAARDAAIARIRSILALSGTDVNSTNKILDVIESAPPSVLAARDAEKWDEGYEAGWGDENFNQRGSSGDRDANEHPHSNPYRAGATNG